MADVLTNFALQNSKRLYYSDKLVAEFTDMRYARPVLSGLEEIELAHGSDAALAVLKYLCETSTLSNYMCKPGARTTLPVVTRQPLPDPAGRNPKYGIKYTCKNCNAKWFDMNGTIKKCPKCKGIPDKKNKGK